MGTFKIVLYLLAVISGLACTALLFRAYARVKLRLLLWSSLCFVCLSISNVLLFVDMVVFPSIDLRPARLIAALVGLLFLLYGFIWEAE
jgi:Family of unknown function (DUF5985)